ncbi:glycosyltransferase [Lentzea sp. NBC_00516]|uniref:glycosyltransferase n=1 Tax=Lentzea sp. NBC_00516 TaxID=2903582 RepID=UPI002E813A92|nr:glycosyltransferase [Lentzea sp. NBC_00516]WUD22752.1 glycosyltransferase [Lentzea sp. NBC_00516]
MSNSMWSPLPPERSGIADYTHELLSHLGDDVEPVDRASPRARSTGVACYQMGNHAGVHSWIYDQALTAPGVVVLHEMSLLDFNLGYCQGLTPEFYKELKDAHGPIWGDPQDPALLHGLPAVEVDGVQMLDSRTMTLESRVVTASRGVIVHDPHSAALLRERFPGKPVFVVPHGAPLRDDTDREAIRSRFGWTDEHVVFGVFGGFNRIKRILVTVLAFAEVRRRWPNARMLIAGHVDYPDVHADVVSAIEQFGLEDSVHLELSPAKDAFEDLITAADVVINLRWPTMGETSGVMMRAFGAGRMVITSDLPQHRHLDSAFCPRVPTEPAREAEKLVALLENVVENPANARAAGKLARDWVAEHASWPVAADGYRRALNGVAVCEKPDDVVPAGVNLFADLRATTGLSESFRRASSAMRRAGLPMTYTEFNSRAPVRTVPVPHKMLELRGGKDHPIDLWMVNLNEFQLIPDTALDRYTIALWAWEMPEILDYTLQQLPRVNELWVVSSYVAETFRTATDVPITVVPNVVTEISPSPDRARFGLNEDAFVVLFTFSASSSDARKNPWGVIEAFRRAFAPHERGTAAQLVIKVVDLDIFPLMAAALQTAVADVNGLLITGDLTRTEMDSLLASCDVYASLHRSEGFGMGMAEAMSIGKPVVATGYSGNTDFMPPGSAGVVGYDIRPITMADHRYDERFADWYRPGLLWAEPNVPQAAAWLRRLADSPTLRARMGAAARQAIWERCSYEAVGKIIRDRVEAIYEERSPAR